jgi:hypothetical protein
MIPRTSFKPVSGVNQGLRFHMTTCFWALNGQKDGTALLFPQLIGWV